MLAKKIMICIFWYPYDIPIIDATERGNAINARSFIEHILKQIVRSPQYKRAKDVNHDFIIHKDNATSSYCKCGHDIFV